MDILKILIIIWSIVHIRWSGTVTVNLFELLVDGEDDKAEEIILQDIPQRKYKMSKRQHGEYFRSILNNIRSMSYLIKDDENVMKEASKKLKSLENFIEESLSRESGTTL